MPRVSVITIAGDESLAVLERCGRALRRQTAPDWEWLIAWEGRAYAGPRRDPRIRWVRADSWNAAVEQAAGDVVLFLDARDELERDALERAKHRFKSQRNALIWGAAAAVAILLVMLTPTDKGPTLYNPAALIAFVCTWLAATAALSAVRGRKRRP